MNQPRLPTFNYGRDTFPECSATPQGPEKAGGRGEISGWLFGVEGGEFKPKGPERSQSPQGLLLNSVNGGNTSSSRPAFQRPFGPPFVALFASSSEPHLRRPQR